MIYNHKFSVKLFYYFSNHRKMLNGVTPLFQGLYTNIVLCFFSDFLVAMATRTLTLTYMYLHG